MYQAKCVECGKELDRWHNRLQLTCSPKCRKRRARRQKDQQSSHVVVMLELQKMRDGIKRGEELVRYREQLQYLKNEINDLLLLAKDPDSIASREMLEDRARRKL
jgi:hypothetical protein